jgi:hypothetical protein
MGFLPWERWLPPYVYGPVLFVLGSALIFLTDTSWWQLMLFALLALYGAGGTVFWWLTRENPFVLEADANKVHEERP